MFVPRAGSESPSTSTFGTARSSPLGSAEAGFADTSIPAAVASAT
ncbi:hypothetical protein OG223_39075 [Streptomyces sp. NBC_01478]|nr:hypothetical protein [Streptomyces sp. NBC_01478]